MIYTVDLYNTFLDAIRVDQRGLSCEVEEFNRMLRIVNQELYDDYIGNFEKDTENIDSLAYFKVLNSSILLSLSGGARVGNMPSNYYYIIGKPRITEDNSDTGVIRRVDLITTYEDAVREDDYLTKATTTHPTCTIGGIDPATSIIQIRVKPTTVTKVWLDYLRTITVPYLDYYINDTTLVKTFLSETSTPQAIGAGYTYRSGTPGGAGVTVTSLTKDTLWDDGDMPLLLAKLIQRIGAQLPDQFLTQVGIAEETKNE